MQDSFIQTFSLMWVLSLGFFTLSLFALKPILDRLNEWADRKVHIKGGSK